MKAFFEGLIFEGAYIRRGSSTEGNLRFKIDWASLTVGSEFTVFLSLTSVFEGNFPNTNPRGAYIRKDDLTEGFLRYRFGWLIFGGAYSCFEKGCRKKCTRQSRKVLWVVLSALFFKEI